MFGTRQVLIVAGPQTRVDLPERGLLLVVECQDGIAPLRGMPDRTKQAAGVLTFSDHVPVLGV